MTTARPGLRGWVVGSIAALMATGCSNEPTPSGMAGKPVSSLAEIGGTWDIASFDGYTPTRLGGGVRHAYVDVNLGRLSYTIECNASGNAAHIDRKGTLHDDEGGRTTTLMGCPAQQATREWALFRFFGSKPKVRWAGLQRLQMSNGTTELLLERPELRRLSFLIPSVKLAGRWVPQMASGLNPANGSTGESFRQPPLVVLTPNSLSYSGCGGVSFTFRYTTHGRMTDVVEQGRTTCGDDFPSATPLKIMRSNPLVERDASGLALIAGDFAVSLEPEGAVQRHRGVNSLQPPKSLRPSSDTPS